MNNAAHFISSTQCGDPGPPNNVYGWGRVDIFAAVGGLADTNTNPDGDANADGDACTNAMQRLDAAYPCALQRRRNVCCQRWQLCLCWRGLQ